MQQAEQRPLVGVPPEHAAAGQAMANGAQLSAPGAPSSAPAVNFNDLSEKYRGCVLETIKAQQAAEEAANKRFVRATEGMSWRQLQMFTGMQHPKTAAEIEMARRADFIRGKE